MTLKFHITLIKSGRGTGPMTPGNRRMRKVLNPAGKFLEDEREHV